MLMKNNKYLILEEIKYSYRYSIFSLILWVFILFWAISHNYSIFYDWSWKQQSLWEWLFFFCSATIFLYMGFTWIKKHTTIEMKKKNRKKISARLTDIWETEYRSTKFTKLTLRDYDTDDVYYTETFIDVHDIFRNWDLIDVYINPEDEDDYYVDLNASFKRYAVKNNWIKDDGEGDK
jgi:hypothetical protein